MVQLEKVMWMSGNLRLPFPASFAVRAADAGEAVGFDSLVDVASHS